MGPHIRVTDWEQQAVLDGAPDTADVQEVKELHRAGMLSAERAATIVRTAMTNNKELEQQARNFARQARELEASVRSLPEHEAEELQNLLQSACCGVGKEYGEVPSELPFAEQVALSSPRREEATCRGALTAQPSPHPGSVLPDSTDEGDEGGDGGEGGDYAVASPNRDDCTTLEAKTKGGEESGKGVHSCEKKKTEDEAKEALAELAGECGCGDGNDMQGEVGEGTEHAQRQASPLGPWALDGSGAEDEVSGWASLDDIIQN